MRYVVVPGFLEVAGIPLVILNFPNEIPKKETKTPMCGCWFAAIVWLSQSPERRNVQSTTVYHYITFHLISVHPPRKAESGTLEAPGRSIFQKTSPLNYTAGIHTKVLP